MTEAEAKVPELQRRIGEVQGERTKLTRRREDVLADKARSSSDSLQKAAEARLEGRDVPPEINHGQELASISREVLVLAEMEKVLRARLEEVKRTRDQERREAAAPEFRQRAQEAYDAGLAFGRALDRLQEPHDALRAVGTNPDPMFPALATQSVRASVPGNRLNGLLNELESAYGARGDRPELKAAQARAEELHIEAQRQKAEGGSIEAGPNGVFRTVGGKRVRVGEVDPKKQAKARRARDGLIEELDYMIAAGPGGAFKIFPDGTQESLATVYSE